MRLARPRGHLYFNTPLVSEVPSRVRGDPGPALALGQRAVPLTNPTEACREPVSHHHAPQIGRKGAASDTRELCFSWSEAICTQSNLHPKQPAAVSNDRKGNGRQTKNKYQSISTDASTHSWGKLGRNLRRLKFESEWVIYTVKEQRGTTKKNPGQAEPRQYCRNERRQVCWAALSQRDGSAARPAPSQTRGQIGRTPRPGLTAESA